MTTKIHAIIFSTKDGWTTRIARNYMISTKINKKVKERVIKKKYKMKNKENNYMDLIYILKNRDKFEKLNEMEPETIRYNGNSRKIWLITGQLK